MVSAERVPRLLFDWVAERLAARLNVRTADLPQPYTLNDVSVALLSEADRLVAGLPAEMQSTHDVRHWRGRIQRAQRTAAT